MKKLSKSEYDDFLVLKGGLFIYTLTNFESRAIIDVDIGVGDVIIPKEEQHKINTLLSDFEVPVIKTYSLESTIAEKFDAILQRFELTGRMKDFYDIYYLSRTFDFDGAKLKADIFETL